MLFNCSQLIGLIVLQNLLLLELLISYLFYCFCEFNNISNWYSSYCIFINCAVFNYRCSILRFSFEQASSFFTLCYINHRLGDIIIIIIIIFSPVTVTLSPLTYSFNQQLSEPLRAQVSNCSTSGIMCAVPSTAVCSTEPTESFPVLCLYFGRFLLFLSLAGHTDTVSARNLT